MFARLRPPLYGPGSGGRFAAGRSTLMVQNSRESIVPVQCTHSCLSLADSGKTPQFHPGASTAPTRLLSPIGEPSLPPLQRCYTPRAPAAAASASASAAA